MLTMPLLVFLLRARLVSLCFSCPCALSLPVQCVHKIIWYRCTPSVLNFNLINSGGNICMSPRPYFCASPPLPFFCLRLQLLSLCFVFFPGFLSFRRRSSDAPSFRRAELYPEKDVRLERTQRDKTAAQSVGCSLSAPRRHDPLRRGAALGRRTPQTLKPKPSNLNPKTKP